MIGKGSYEIEIDGEKVGFEFGMLASAYSEEASGKSIFELFEDIKKVKIKALLHYFYGAARAYTELRGLTEVPTVGSVSKLIDKIELQELLTIYSKSIGSYLPKNVEAPTVETGHQVETQAEA